MLLSTPRTVILLICPLCCDVCSTSCVRPCYAVLCYVKGIINRKTRAASCMLHVHLPCHTQEERPCTPIVCLGMATNFGPYH
jgi:hypothetical protein